MFVSVKNKKKYYLNKKSMTIIHTCAFGTRDPVKANTNASTFQKNGSEIKLWTSITQLDSLDWGEDSTYVIFAALMARLKTPFLESLLGRLAAVYLFGGLYVDDDMRCISQNIPFSPPPNLVLVRKGDEYPINVHWGVFYSGGVKCEHLKNVMNYMLSAAGDDIIIKNDCYAARRIYSSLQKEFNSSSGIILLPKYVVVHDREELFPYTMILAGSRGFPTDNFLSHVFREVSNTLSSYKVTGYIYNFCAAVFIGIIVTICVTMIINPKRMKLKRI
jgi:hypothetical protein